MVIVVPVTAISGLLGLHKYRDRDTSLHDLLHPCKKKHPVFEQVKRLLYHTEFYTTFCRAPKITHQLRVRARLLVDKACERAGIRYNKPYSYFLKQRGLYLEQLNTDRCEALFKEKITHRQFKLQKNFDDFLVRGSVDGKSTSHIYEIKTRATFLNIREWEKVQLAWYCHIGRLPGRLVAFLGNEHCVWECTIQQADEMVAQQVLELRNLLLHEQTHKECLITCGA